MWNLARTRQIGSSTPQHFFKALERAGSLDRLVDKMKRLPGRARTTRELTRLVWLKEKGESPWPAMKRSSIVIVQPISPLTIRTAAFNVSSPWERPSNNWFNKQGNPAGPWTR